jgi:hypothetical protein
MPKMETVIGIAFSGRLYAADVAKIYFVRSEKFYQREINSALLSVAESTPLYLFE